MRWLFILHRYFGIVLGVLMLMWCLSGAVMMYVAYPELSEATRMGALEAIDWEHCCTIGSAALSDAEEISHFEVEMLAGQPVLRLIARGSQAVRLINLATGDPVRTISREEAQNVALQLGQVGGHWDPPQYLGLTDYDQWTISGGFRLDRPLFRFSIDDAAQTQVYVSSTTGRAVQRVTARERFWNWVGAVPHWLYFSRLRREAWLWRDVVIGASLAGCFLALTGIYIGVRQFTRRPQGRWSGYDGVKLWHHVPGLTFGLFVLGWIASGLFSMNPWGFLDSAGAGTEREILLGRPLTGSGVRAILQSLSSARPVGEIVSVESAPWLGQQFCILTNHQGERRRIDVAGTIAPLSASQVLLAAHSLAKGRSFEPPELIHSEDRYYFSHHRETALLPAYRIVLMDGTRYYLDPVSGALLSKVDRNAKGYRWLHQALHRMDFSPSLRARPTWDVLMLLLLSGASLVCATGAYLGLRRLL
jgi:uncharacterized iron-regulated membrane protein